MTTTPVPIGDPVYAAAVRSLQLDLIMRTTRIVHTASSNALLTSIACPGDLAPPSEYTAAGITDSILAAVKTFHGGVMVAHEAFEEREYGQMLRRDGIVG